jgi:hypothetical protein
VAGGGLTLPALDRSRVSVRSRCAAAARAGHVRPDLVADRSRPGLRDGEWPTSTLQVVAQPGGTARTITPEGAYGAANRRGLQWTDPGLFGYVGGKPTLLRLA